MSFGFPVVYAQPESLGVPSMIMGDDLKSFSGAKNSIRSVPTMSGSSVGPSSSILFNIPTGGNSYIKPNSMYLRLKCVVTQAAAAANTWAFAGQSSEDTYDSGGASSLINRINITFPGGSTVSYGNYNHWRNAILPHIAATGFMYNDLRVMEFAGVSKLNTDASVGSQTVYVSIPLFIPIFNSNQAFPALLLSGSGINIEFITESLNNAIYAFTTAVTAYALSEISLVYETLDVSQSYKEAIFSAKANSFYNISVEDWASVGPVATTSAMSYQIGCGYSSLKSILFTEQSTITNTTTKKMYNYNGLNDIKLYVNNQIVSPPNMNEESYVYCETQRALGRINDFLIQSAISGVTSNVIAGNLRTTYTISNFLAGISTQSFSDWGFSSTGIPASTLTLELSHTTTADPIKWEDATLAYAAASLYVFMAYDSVYSVDLSNGTLMIRK
jgi:hypothetical protein